MKQKIKKMKNIFILLFILLPHSLAYSCTIFCVVENGKVYFCNNEDWSDTNTIIKFHAVKKGKYGWVYLGYEDNWAQGGVNDQGLCWDWVAWKEEKSWKADSKKITLKGNPSEKMITKCSSLDEAIKFYDKYNEPSFASARMMIADKDGQSAILSWKDGKLNIERLNGKLLAFGYKGPVVDSFFQTNTTKETIRKLTEALNCSHQEGKYPTQYSNIISLTDGKLYLFKSHNFQKYAEINYLTELNQKNRSIKISDLFADDFNKTGIRLVESITNSNQ
ncbi:MAG: hypothetical protein ABI685_11115 [Ferruginibacter sp.]